MDAVGVKGQTPRRYSRTLRPQRLTTYLGLQDLNHPLSRCLPQTIHLWTSLVESPNGDALIRDFMVRGLDLPQPHK